jgi:hypothetical protein
MDAWRSVGSASVTDAPRSLVSTTSSAASTTTSSAGRARSGASTAPCTTPERAAVAAAEADAAAASPGPACASGPWSSASATISTRAASTDASDSDGATAGAPAAAAAAAAGAADSTPSPVPGLRGERSAVVVSVVIEAATRWRVVAARRRASAVVALTCAPDAAGVRADFAASPRTEAASDEAAREAALRFDDAVDAVRFDDFGARGLGASEDGESAA